MLTPMIKILITGRLAFIIDELPADIDTATMPISLLLMPMLPADDAADASWYAAI